MVSVACGKRTRQCGQNAELINVEAGDTNCYYHTVKNWKIKSENCFQFMVIK